MRSRRKCRTVVVSNDGNGSWTARSLSEVHVGDYLLPFRCPYLGSTGGLQGWRFSVCQWSSCHLTTQQCDVPKVVLGWSSWFRT